MNVGTLEIQILTGIARLQKDMDEAKGVVERTTGKMSSAFSALKGVVGTIGVGALIKEALEMADTFKTLEAKLTLVSTSAQAGQEQLRLLTEVANRQLAPISELAQLYAGAARSSDNLGASSQQLTKFTEGVAAALRISATNSASASGALTQLTQMLGGAKVQAQEFNSIVDGAPEILRIVRENLGDTTLSMGELREMVTKGKLTSQEFFQAFLKGADELIEKAGTMPMTIGGAFTVLKNNIIVAVGDIDRVVGASGTIAAGVRALADFIPSLVGPIQALASGMGAALRIASAYFAIFVGGPAVIAAFAGALAAARAAMATFQIAAAISGSSLTAFGLAMGTATAGTLTLTTAVSGLKLASMALFALYAGVEIGRWLNDEFELAAQAGNLFVDAMLKAWEEIKFAAKAAWTVIAHSFEASISTMGGAIAWFLKTFAGGLSALGLDSASEKVLLWAGKISDATKSTESLSGKLEDLRAETDRNKDAIQAQTERIALDTTAKFENKESTEKLFGRTKELEDAIKRAAAQTKDSTDKQEANRKEAEKQQKAYEKLVDELEGKVEVLKAATENQGDLTESQKRAIEIGRDLRDGTHNLTEKQRAYVEKLLAEIESQEDVIDVQKRAKEASERARKERDASIESIEANVRKLEAEIEKTELSNEVLRGNKTAIEEADEARYLSLAASSERQAQIALERGEDEAQYEALMKQRDAYLELAELKRDEVPLKIAKEAREEWEKTADSIKNGLTDSLFRAFESGKDFFSTLWEGVKNTFKTTILKPIIENTVDNFIKWFFDGKSLIEATDIFPSFAKGPISDFVNWFFGGKKAIESADIVPEISNAGTNSFLNTFADGLKSVMEWFKNAFSGILKWLGDALGGIFDWLGSAFSGIGSWVSDLFGGSGGGVLDNVAGLFTDGAGSVLGNLSSIGSAISGLWNGVGIGATTSAPINAALIEAGLSGGAQSGVGAWFSSLFGGGGAGAGAGAGAAAGGAGGLGAGAGAGAGASGLGAAAGLAAAAYIAAGIWGIHQNPDTPLSSFGGAFRFDEGQGFRTLGEGYNGPIEGADQAAALTVAAINAFLEQMGSSERLAAFQAGLHTGESGMPTGGVYAGGRLTSGRTFGEVREATDPIIAEANAIWETLHDESGSSDYLRGFNPNTLFEGSVADQELTDFGRLMDIFGHDLSQAILQAMIAAIDTLPDEAQTLLNSISDAELLTPAEASSVLQRLNAIAAARAAAEEEEEAALQGSAELSHDPSQVGFSDQEVSPWAGGSTGKKDPAFYSTDRSTGGEDLWTMDDASRYSAAAAASSEVIADLNNQIRELSHTVNQLLGELSSNFNSTKDYMRRTTDVLERVSQNGTSLRTTAV